MVLYMPEGDTGYAPRRPFPDSHCLNRAIAIDREADSRAAVPRVGRSDQVLAPILDPLDRPPERNCGQDHRNLFASDEHLLSEAAADVADSDRYLGLRDAQVATEKSPDIVDGLA
jgi:hypothetical protein